VNVRGAYLLFAIALAARVVATFLPSPWLWGLDSLADRSLALKIAGLALFALAVVPAIGRATMCACRATAARVPSRLLAIALCAVGVGLLLLLRSENLLLGDTQTYVSAIQKGVRSAGGAHREPLAQAAVIGTYKLLHALAGWEPTAAFTVTGALLGTCAFLCAAAIARRLSTSLPGRIWVFSLVGLTGALQLFSGYAEFYGFVVAAALLFALTGLRRCDGRGGIIPAVLSFALAGLCHAQMVFALPAVAYLLALEWRHGRKKAAVLATILLPAATLVALVLLRYPFGELAKEAARAGSLLPPFGAATPRTAYGAFAPAHLAELLNVALLVSPVLPAAIWLGARRDRERTSRAIFLALLAAGPAFFALMANPQLGMVRDWDIFALPAILVCLATAPAAARLLDHADGHARTATTSTAGAPAPRPAVAATTRGAHRLVRVDAGALAGTILLTSLLHAGLWLDANHLPDPSRERVRRVAGCANFFGPQSLGEVWRYIGSAELRSGQRERALQSYRAAIEGDPDERMTYRLLAGLMIERSAQGGQGPAAGIASYHASLAGGRQRPAYAAWGGAIAAFAFGQGDLAMREAQAMLAAEPEHPELLATMGDFLRVNGRDAEAGAMYERALARDPDQPRARLGLACLAALRGDRATYESQVEEALRRTPWAPHVQQFVQSAGRSPQASPESYRRYFYVR
jgi:hypothetical protein